MNRLLFLAVAAPLFAQQLTIVSGNGQLLREQFLSVQPMVVRAVDASGRPQAGATINWEVTRGQGTIRNPQTQTNEDGLAQAHFLATSIQPSSSTLPSVVTATSVSGSRVEFHMITVESTGGGTGQPIIQAYYGEGVLRGSAGSTLATPIEVVVAASTGAYLGRGIPNVGVRAVPSANADSSSPTAVCNGPGGMVLTDERGRASCHLTLGPNTGTASIRLIIGETVSTREFGIEVTQGQSCNVTVNPANLNFGASGGTATFNVSAVNCAWTASSGASWVSFPGTVSGTGSGQVTVNIAPNSGPSRSALISVGNATLNVSQTASGTSLPLTFAISQNLPQATAGISYSTTISVSGGQAPYTWTATSSLPSGISLNSSTGVLSGTVSTAGSYSIPVTVRDSAGATINQIFNLVVSTSANPGGGGLAFTTTSLPSAAMNVSYSQEIRATGGCPNPFFGGVRLEIITGGLPPGMTAQSAQGGSGLVISGTPTQPGNFQFGVRASDACGSFITREYNIAVSTSSAVPLMTASSVGVTFTLQRGSGRTPAEQTVTLTTGSAGIAFTASATSDGGWLAITPTTGTTTASITARVANTELQPGTYTGSITIVSEAPNSPLIIPATLTVTATQAVSVSPTALTFDYEPGGIVPPPQTINVSASGGVFPFTSTATTTTGAAWLSVFQIGPSTPGLVNVGINAAGLPPGSYSGSVIVTPAFGVAPITVPVTLNVGRGQQVTTPAVTSVVNGASFLAGPIAPGEIVTIYGTSIGPAALTTYRLTSSGMIDTQLGEARVYFDNIPAPLLYASGTQTTVVVPYGIGGRTSASLVIEYRGVRSAPMTVPVAESAPALFTIGGGSQGAILNQDNTVNGPQNGAQPGSIVSLYATGEGITIPGGVEGSIVAAAALAKPVLPVTVTIGGRTAEVLYAGSAPGQPAGLLQVNARIPAETPVGTNVPVVLTVGNATSQSGVTLFVRP